MTDFSKFIRDIPDFPQPGILFKDITPLLQDPHAFRGGGGYNGSPLRIEKY